MIGLRNANPDITGEGIVAIRNVQPRMGVTFLTVLAMFNMPLSQTEGSYWNGYEITVVGDAGNRS